MDIKILNKQFETVYIVDQYESFIWTERYNDCGDFELTTDASLQNYEIFTLDNYVEIDNSDYTMIIESITTTSDPDNGIKMTVTGRSLESILDRRIFLKEFNIDGGSGNPVKLWSAIETCLKKTLLPTSTIIEGTAANRKINNFIFTVPEDTDPIKSVSLDETIQMSLGDSVLDTIVSLCQEKHVGFRLKRNGQNFIFSIFCGVNRSFSQSSNLFVIFSTEFDNIINSSFLYSTKNYKNTALVSGEGNDSTKTKVTVGDENTGLDRREVYISAIKVTQGSGTTQTYSQRLTAKGKEELSKSEYKITKSFEGEIENKNVFEYNKDYFIGDIVELKNEFGVGSHSRITEFIFSDSAEGFTCYPTFIDTEEED